MHEFGVVFKKELKECIRTKKFLLFSLIACALQLFTFMIFGVLDAMLKTPGLGVDKNTLSLFSLTYENMTSYSMAIISTYFVIAIIIFLRSYMSKEIKDKKWILPMQSGIKPQTLIIARMLAITLTVLVSLILSLIINFVLCLIFCKPETYIEKTEGVMIYVTMKKSTCILNLLYSYLMISIYVLFITVLVLGLSSTTKKPALVILISLLLILVVDTILSSIIIHFNSWSVALQSFTPFMFAGQATNKVSLPWSCYLVASLITVGIMALLVVLSLFTTKIKGQKQR